MDKSIITIKQAHSIENVISKSRFIAYIKPVSTENEAKAFIDEIKTDVHMVTFYGNLNDLIQLVQDPIPHQQIWSSIPSPF